MKVIKPAHELYGKYVQVIVSGEIAQNLNVDRAIHAWSNFDSTFLGLSGHMLGLKGDLTDFNSILQAFSSFEDTLDLEDILFDLLFEAQQNSDDSLERFSKELSAQESSWERLSFVQQDALLDAILYKRVDDMKPVYRIMFNQDLLRHFKSLCDSLLLADSLDVLSEPYAQKTLDALKKAVAFRQGDFCLGIQ